MNDDTRKLSHYYRNYYLRLLRGDFNVLQSNIFLVRYEDLVTRTRQVVDQIREFTGLALADYDPDAEWQRSAEDYDQRRRDPDLAAWTTELHGRSVSDSRIGKYRDVLSDEDIAIIEQECQAVMRSFKYDPLPARHASA